MRGHAHRQRRARARFGLGLARSIRSNGPTPTTIRRARSPSSCRWRRAPAWTPWCGSMRTSCHSASASRWSSTIGPAVPASSPAKPSRRYARRLHARGGDQRHHGDQTDPVQAAAVQSTDRLRADLQLRQIAVRVHRQSVAAGPLSPGIHQICQGAAGTDQLQLVGYRRRASPDRRTAQAEVRLRHGARAVSQQPAIDRRCRRRSRAGLGRRGGRLAAADQGRQAARASRSPRRRASPPCPMSRRSPRRSGCRTSRRCLGTCCLPVTTRRARSSTSSMAR